MFIALAKSLNVWLVIDKKIPNDSIAKLPSTSKQVLVTLARDKSDFSHDG